MTSLAELKELERLSRIVKLHHVLILQESSVPRNSEHQRAIAGHFVSTQDTEGLLSYLSFILGRPDYIKLAIDALLKYIDDNYDTLAKFYKSPISFAEKLIDILSGQVLLAFLVFILGGF